MFINQRNIVQRRTYSSIITHLPYNYIITRCSSVESSKTEVDYNKEINIFNVRRYCKSAETLPEHLRKKKLYPTRHHLLCTPGGLTRPRYSVSSSYVEGELLFAPLLQCTRHMTFLIITRRNRVYQPIMINYRSDK